MNVKIISDLGGEMQFDMSAESCLKLIAAATKYAAEGESTENVTTYYADGEPYKQEVQREPVTTPESHSRIHTLFGDYKSRIPISSVLPEVRRREQTYKGFLLIKCEDCGRIRGFNANTPQTAFFCHCGNATKLENLRPAFLHCKKCGITFRYMTNMDSPRFAYSCLNCGRKINLVLNERETAFVTEC